MPIAAAMAARRSTSTTASGPAPSTTAFTMASGSSERGLSLVITARSAVAAARPMSRRLSRSRSPAAPATAITRPEPTSSRAAAITAPTPSGVWA